MANYAKGSRGSVVAKIQSALFKYYRNEAGLRGVLSSEELSILDKEISVQTFGNSTEKLVKAFQLANGLGDDGVVGPNTASALGISLPAGAAAAAPLTAMVPVVSEPWFVPVVAGLALLALVGTVYVMRTRG